MGFHEFQSWKCHWRIIEDWLLKGLPPVSHLCSAAGGLAYQEWPVSPTVVSHFEAMPSVGSIFGQWLGFDLDLLGHRLSMIITGLFLVYFICISGLFLNIFYYFLDYFWGSRIFQNYFEDDLKIFWNTLNMLEGSSWYHHDYFMIHHGLHWNILITSYIIL